MAQIEIQNLTFSYPDSKHNTLDNICLSIEQGDYILVCGQSGSGKTTLLRHLKSVLTPHGKRSGSVRIDGREIAELPDQASRIGFVLQNPDDQIVTDKVWHELAFGLESIGCDATKMRLRVAEMASFFGIQSWFHQDTALLSGGQKQLLNLASVMAMQPEILVLDEPTAQLDPIAAADFLSTVHKLHQELGITVIITEHRIEEICPSVDRVVVLHDGRIIADDAPRTVGAALLEHPLFDAFPTPLRIAQRCAAQDLAPLSVREGRQWLRATLQGNELHNRSLQMPTPPSADPALTIKDLRFRYEKNLPDVLSEVQLSVPQGSLFAIVGGNGCGKSTLLKNICGVCRPYYGKIKLFGKDLKKYQHSELFRNLLCMLPQDPKNLFSKATAEQELREMTDGSIDEIVTLCHLTELRKKHPYDLSGGEQQRLALAKVLLTKPRLLLLDEPTKGLDIEFKKELARILCKLKTDGVTILMVSHDIEFCAEYADLVGMFFNGQLLTVDIPQRFFGENSFYTTAANRMSRGIFTNAVTANDVITLWQQNMEQAP